MKKSWKVDGKSGTFSSFDEASTAAKRSAALNSADYGIYELVAYAQATVPAIDIVAVTA